MDTKLSDVTKTRNRSSASKRTAGKLPRSAAAKRPQRSLEERGLVRLTLDVPADDANKLVETADRTGYNKTTTVMRAIRLLFDLERVVRDGGQVTLTHADGTKERIILR